MYLKKQRDGAIAPPLCFFILSVFRDICQAYFPALFLVTSRTAPADTISIRAAAAIGAESPVFAAFSAPLFPAPAPAPALPLWLLFPELQPARRLTADTPIKNIDNNFFAFMMIITPFLRILFICFYPEYIREDPF